MARHMLYEAANCLLVRVRNWSAPKVARLVKRIGHRKASVALARKLAVMLHSIWLTGEDFQTTKEAIAGVRKK